MKVESHFKGWAKPGPVPPGLTAPALTGSGPLTVAAQETLDAISGHFRLFQLADGHRFSTDDILTAWYGTSWCPTARRVLDLGSGLGTVGMICAWRLPGRSLSPSKRRRKAWRWRGNRRVTTAWKRGTKSAKAIFARRRCFARARRLISSPAARPIFRRTRESRASIRKSWPAVLNCAAPWRIIAPRRPCTWPRADFLPACFRMNPPNAPAWRRRPGTRGWLLCASVRWCFAKGDPALVALFGLMRAEDLPEWFRGQTWTEPDLIIRTREGKIHPEYSAVKLAIGFPP